MSPRLLKMKKTDLLSCIFLFFGFFSLYLYTCSPHLPPYRDAGEMATVLTTLGVAHPPGYAFYTVFGNLFAHIPLANHVFRINLISCVSAAGALVFLFLTMRVWLSLFPSLIACFAYGLSNPFWELAGVTEMYTLGIFWLALLFYVCFSLKNPCLAGFLMALGLGIRMDMLLLYPLFFLWFYKENHFRQWPLFGLFFILGLSIFLYMPIRSLQDPLIDWANPESLSNLFHSISRKSYGGTLDLLSLNYKKGDNFLIGFLHFIRNGYQSYGPVYWGLLVGGVVCLVKNRPRPLIFFLFAFLLTGPLYLFLANMPPNPHALAVLEANYPVIDLMLLFFAAYGVQLFMKKNIVKKALMVILPLLFLVNAGHSYNRANRRNNFYARDQWKQWIHAIKTLVKTPTSKGL